MNITIDVAAYYSWESCPTPKGALPDATEEDKKDLQADLLALRLKPASDAKTLDGQAVKSEWLRKVLVEQPSQTTINIPEPQIVDMLIHYFRKGINKTRANYVAWTLEENTMPHHAHPMHFEKITVHDEGPSDIAAIASLESHWKEVLSSEASTTFLNQYMADKTNVEEYLARYFDATSGTPKGA